MNNKELREALTMSRNALNVALNKLDRYEEETKAGRWTSGVVRSNFMAQIRVNADLGGVDTSTWTGDPAPEPSPVLLEN